MLNFISAFESKVGDWKFYICQMTYADVSRGIGFAYELSSNQNLSALLQRGLTKRTDDIKRYLLESKHHFLGAIIVAAWGGVPEFIKLDAVDPSGFLPNGLLSEITKNFGVLKFDGTQSFFALDGQHRLRAIKDAVAENPARGTDEISVLLVTHMDTEEGRQRTRRLFTNINRNAKPTTIGENIALDVDDTIAITTRRLIEEHWFLSKDRRVRVFTKPPTGDGVVRIAGKSIPQNEPHAWTTLTTLYSLVHELALDGHPDALDRTTRPTDEVLEDTYRMIARRLDDLLAACGDVPELLATGDSAQELRTPRGGHGHAFMRPVIQIAVAHVAAYVVRERGADWRLIMDRLRALQWNIQNAPWICDYNVALRLMLAGKIYAELLKRMLKVHLYPLSTEEIQEARQAFLDLMGYEYPVSEEELRQLLDEQAALGNDESESGDNEESFDERSDEGDDEGDGTDDGEGVAD